MKTVQFISQLIIPLFILLVVGYGWAKKVRVYDSFVGGAKDGISVVIKIFPYLLAIFVAVKSFEASGVFAFTKDFFLRMLSAFNIPLEVISIAIIKPSQVEWPAAIDNEICVGYHAFPFSISRMRS